MMAQERIAAAAIQLANGEVFSAPPPARHPSVLLLAQADGMNPLRMLGHVQGFLTRAGRFVDRQEAWGIALSARQILMNMTNPPKPVSPTPGTLYTEDLW